jgi:hypothetical protein
VLLAKAADQAGLTAGLVAALRKAGTSPVLDRGILLVSMAAAIALGATSMSDIAVLAHLAPVLGAAPSGPTVRRALDLAGTPAMLDRIARARAKGGAGNNRAVSTATASSFLNTAGKVGRVTISERIEAGRRERRVLTRVSRAAWRLEQAERERTWALASARAEGISIRTLAKAAGLSPSRVHQLVAAADLDALDAALGELRAAGWPAPEDPDSGEDTELDGRDNIADRLSDEVGWLRPVRRLAQAA